MAEFKDKTGFTIMKGDTAIFTDSEGADLAKGIVMDLGEKMVRIERIGRGVPRNVRRYPEQVVVVTPQMKETGV